MKRAIIFFTCTAVLLLGLNLLGRSKTIPVRVPEVVSNATTGETKRAKVEQASTNAAAPALTWDQMETADYKAYIANLRRVGFPEELIREIIIADVNKLYADREEPLKIPPVPQDAPLEARRRKPTVADIENLMKLRDIQMEKHQLLEQLLGVKVPREIVRTPNSRNYEAADYAVRQLPPEKQQAALEIYEKEILLDDLNQARGLRGAEELAAYRRVNEERDAALRELLTPEEFERLMMNAIPPGTEMQRRVMGMEATDEEMLAMWKVTHEHWKEQGGVFGRWRAEPVPPEQLKAADEKLNQNLEAVLGPERYLDYQLATSGTGQQLRNFAARYGLPREKLADAFRLQKEMDALRSSQGRARNGSAPEPSPESAARLEQVQGQLEQTLGAELFRSWNEGRNLKYDFQP
jgi:hypothetical protein